jgi:hypothetical protein
MIKTLTTKRYVGSNQRLQMFSLSVTQRTNLAMTPASRERYVVPSWTVSCGDGSLPVNGQGIALAGMGRQNLCSTDQTDHGGSRDRGVDEVGL